MSSNLWNNFNFEAPIECLIDTTIREFDISQANISILTELGYLEPDQYQALSISPKLDREIFIGKFIGRNNAASEALKQGILDAKRKFFEANQLEDKDVLKIANDAVYIIGNKYIHTQQVSNLVYFRLASQYTSYYAVKKTRYFYYGNIITRQEYLVTKGLGSGEELHKQFMLDFLKELFFTAQFEGTKKAIELLSVFYNQYISMILPLGFYRNINSESMFAYKNFDQYARFMTNIEDPRMRNIIDIGYNEKILREFNRILSNEYFKKNK